MNVVADNGSTGSTRTDADLVIDDITIDGYAVNDKYVKESHQITVILNNTGATDIVGKKLNCSIYNSTGVEAFTNVDCGTVTAGATKDVLLPLWTPDDEDTYWINITISLTTGGNLTANKSFVISDVYDLYPVLTFPSGDIDRWVPDETNQSLVCKADVYNIGNVVVGNFNVTLEVWKGGAKLFNDTRPYSSIAFNPGTSFSAPFTKWYNHSYGQFQFKVYTAMPVQDANISNDMDIQTFWVNYTIYDKPRGNIEGVVVENGTNATLEGVLVTLDDPALNLSMLTDANGTFCFMDLPVDHNPYALNFSLDGYYNARVEDIMVENATTNNTGNVTMNKIPLCTLKGFVLAQDNTPLTGVTVTMGTLTNTSNETGYYQFLNVTANTYSLKAFFAGYRDYEGMIILVPGETMEKNITMIPVVNVTVTFQPEDGATGVSPDEVILITFNTAFDPATVNGTTVFLKQAGANGSIDIGIKPTDDTIIEIVPTGGLKYGFTYTVTVTNGVKNIYNESMLDDNETTATFSTMLPGVLSHVPEVEAVNISVDIDMITITFNTDMSMPSPIPADYFVLRAKAAEEINGTLAYDAVTRTLTFTLGEDLAYETTYVVSVAKFTSVDGIEMESYSFEFNTVKPTVVPTTGGFSGFVLYPNGTGVSGAEVMIEGYPVQITDDTGYYEFTDIDQGTYNLTVTFTGYDQYTTQVTVVGGVDDATVPNISLIESEVEDEEESFFSQYWWVLLIIALVVIVIIIVIVVLMMRKKPEEEEEETGGRRYAPERRERPTPSGGAAASTGGRADREYSDEEVEGSECPNCGEIVSDADVECPNCGVEFEEDLFECPVCGEHVDFEATECASCGATFQEEIEEEEEEEYDEEEEPDYEVEVEDEDGVTRYNPAEEDEEEYGEEPIDEEEYD